MEEIKTQLPENAFRELQEGEEYEPLMSPHGQYPEVNTWSVTWGVIMAMLFSAAAAYLGLKVGQVFEAAIPIAIIAVGVSTAAKRNKALGENVIIQSIGACSGAVVAGAIFTLPAIYILQAKYGTEMSASFLQVFMASALGGILGILFLIPFRHTGAGERSEGWRPGQAAYRGRSHWWTLRLHRGHFWLVERGGDHSHGGLWRDHC